MAEFTLYSVGPIEEIESETGSYFASKCEVIVDEEIVVVYVDVCVSSLGVSAIEAHLERTLRDG